jgi:hypothetical protein
VEGEGGGKGGLGGCLEASEVNVLVQRDSVQRQGRSVRISFELEKHRGLECDGPVNLLN